MEYRKPLKIKISRLCFHKIFINLGEPFIYYLLPNLEYYCDVFNEKNKYLIKLIVKYTFSSVIS